MFKSPQETIGICIARTQEGFPPKSTQVKEILLKCCFVYFRVARGMRHARQCNSQDTSDLRGWSLPCWMARMTATSPGRSTLDEVNQKPGMGQGWVWNLVELYCYARCQEMMLKEHICMGSPPWLVSRCQIKLVEVSNTSHPNGLQRAFSFCSGSMFWTNTRRNSDVALHSWSWCLDVFKKWVAWMESQSTPFALDELN